MVIATIDIGTNTGLLLIAEVGSDFQIKPLYDEQRFVRLGEGVDATGEISTAAMERLRDTLTAYREIAERWSSEQIIVVGTSASRDARNREELVELVARETGLHYEILPGDEEAQWSFMGALSAFHHLDGPVLIVDVGGGSTEVTLGRYDSAGPVGGTFSYRQSLNIGAVRLKERLFSNLPPRKEDILKMDRLIQQEIEKAGLPGRSEITFIGSAGTASALALVHAGIKEWDESQVSSITLNAGEMAYWRNLLLTLNYDRVLALNEPVLLGRADVFPAGVAILEAIFRHSGADVCRISPRGLRHGIALRFLQRQFRS